MSVEWNTERPEKSGYYLGAWRRDSHSRWFVSELWFNPDSTGSGWWISRGYLAPRTLYTDTKTIPVEAWTPVPEYKPEGGDDGQEDADSRVHGTDETA